MLRKWCVIVLCCCACVACSDSKEQPDTSAEVIDKGLAAIAAKDWGKAEGIFELAENNETAQHYYEQVVLLREGEEMLTNGDLEGGKERLAEAANYQEGSSLIAEMAKALLASVSVPAEEQSVEVEVAASTNVTEEKKADIISDKASNMTYVQLANEQGNVRAQPSIDSMIVHEGKQYDVFVYLQEKVNTADGRTWYKVEYSSGQIGYISRAVATLTNEAPLYVRLIEEGANIRSEPSLNAAVLYTGSKDETFYYYDDKTYTKDGRTWLHILLPNGSYGYVSQKVATMTTDYTLNEKYAHFDSEVIVTAEKANVRAYPSIDSDVILENIPKGTAFSYTGYSTTTADGRVWYEIQVNHNSYYFGYISKAVSRVE